MRTIKFLVTIGCLALLATPVAAQGQIGWLADWRSARDQAQAQNRPVLLHFWSSTCVPCKQLERNVFSKSEVARAMAAYVPVKINTDESPQLARFYQVDRVPTDIVVDPNGRVLLSSASPQDANQYISMLDAVKARYYSGIDGSRVARSTSTPTPNYPGDSGAGNSGTGLPAQPAAAQGFRGSSFPAQGPNQGVNPSPQPSGQPTAGGVFGANGSQQASLAPQYASPYGNSNAAAGGQTAAASKVQWNEHLGANGSAPTAGGGFAAANPAAGSTFGGTAQSTHNAPLNPGSSQQAGLGQQQAAPAHSSHFAGSQHAAGGAANGVFSPPAAAQANQPQPAPSGPPIGLDGFCPVSLVEQANWAAGDRRWGARHRGRIYLFSSQANQQRFFNNPDAYSPVLSGYDPVRYSEMGELVDGRREHGLYFGSQYYLFADESSLERFRLNPQHYVAIAQQAMRQTAGQTPQR